jgi:hypothetical protein
MKTANLCRSQECLALVADTSLSGVRVGREEVYDQSIKRGH